MTPGIEKLQYLYQQLEQQQAAGEDVVAELKKEINNLELAYLKEHILPEVAGFLASKVRNLRCVIDSNFQYDGTQKIDYSFCTSGSMLIVKDNVDINSIGESPVSDSPQDVRKRINSKTSDQDIQSQSLVAPYDVNLIYKHFSTLIKNLRTEKNKVGYRSPNKAILLLAIFEAIYDGDLKENKIYFNPSLIRRYERLWKDYVPAHLNFNSNPSAPYVHLASETFFSHVLYKPISNLNQNWNPTKVRASIRYARLNEKLFSIVKHRYNDFKKLLVDTYLVFPKPVSSKKSKTLISNNPPIDSVVPSEPKEPLTTPLPSKKTQKIDQQLHCNEKLKLIITPDFTLTGQTPTAMIAAFIRLVGVKKVYNLKIPYLGKFLVDTARHPKYIGQTKYVDGYWVNTCSSTTKKIKQMQEIADRLGIDIKFIVE